MSAISIRRRPSVAVSSAKEAKQILRSQGMLKVYAVWLLVAALLVALAVASERILMAIDSPIKTIEISGDHQNVTNEELSHHLDRWVNTSFMGADLSEIKASIEAMPWVHSVVASRAWPDKLHLNITEQVAVANWGHSAYLNQEGEIFTPSVIESSEHRILLIGPNDAPLSTRLEMIQKAAELRSDLSPLGIDVASLILNERGAWELGIANGPVIALGAENSDARLHRALQVYKRMKPEALAQVDRLDARYTNGVAVRWKEVEIASSYEFVSSSLR